MNKELVGGLSLVEPSDESKKDPTHTHTHTHTHTQPRSPPRTGWVAMAGW